MQVYGERTVIGRVYPPAVIHSALTDVEIKKYTNMKGSLVARQILIYIFALLDKCFQ